MRAIHRILSLFVVLVTLYLGLSGTLIQAIDLKTLLNHAPATDPDMIAIREDKDGPYNYQVLDVPDYTAATLPAATNYSAAFAELTAAARTTVGNAPIDYAEVRMGEGGLVGVVAANRKLLQYDFRSRQAEARPMHYNRLPPSTRDAVKHLHRMTSFGDWALWINPFVGVALGVFVVTGVILYWRLLSARQRIRRPQWFWKAGGWWRSLHRWVSISASLFILVIALSGTWLAVESLIFGYYLSSHMPRPGKPMVPPVSAVTPLSDVQIPGMLSVTLKEYQTSLRDQPLKVLRLRNFGGMPQGILVAGLGDDTQQVVVNTSNGKRAGLTEPGYPDTGFPFGWQAHQIAKQVHRGSYFGMSGRWMDLIGGLAIIYLSFSAIVMYVDMWNRRRRAGRKSLIWT